MKDLYEILDVMSTATREEITKAYRKQALIHHPDKGGSGERFNQLREAYETLSDRHKRVEFDQLRDLFREEDLSEEEELTQDLERLSTSGLPYSHEYRQQHDQLVRVFSENP